MEIGFAMCGSFCTFSEVFPVMEALSADHHLIPIFSFAAGSIDSRFGTATEHLELARKICGRSPLRTIEGVEPIGPKKMLDALIIAPCTGNTLSKMRCGITDTAVLMAVKAQIRNERPVVLAVSSNDGLGAAAPNIGELLNRRHLYFVPLRQDDPVGKPRSAVADLTRCIPALDAALTGVQLQPVWI